MKTSPVSPKVFCTVDVPFSNAERVGMIGDLV